MLMKNLMFLLFITIGSFGVYGQQNTREFYRDTLSSYQVVIPEWFTVRNTNATNLWGGTLPAVDGIENAIVIKAYAKKTGSSFFGFKKYVVEGLSFGKTPPWSSSHHFMGKKDLGIYKGIGDSYIVYLMRGGLIYHCKYVLLESRTAYIWIDFTATEKTFDKNMPKFDEFMAGFNAN